MTIFDSRDFAWHEPPGHVRGFSKYLVSPQYHGSRHVDFRLSRYPQHGRVDAHRHAVSEQVYYVISGNARLLHGDDDVVLGPGQGAFIPPGLVHAVENTGDEDLVFVVVTTPPGDVAG